MHSAVAALGERIRFVANGKPQEFRFKGLWISEAPGDELVTLEE